MSNLILKMEDQADSKNIVLNNGLYYGIILVIASLIMYALGLHLNTTAAYVNLFITALVLIVFPVLGMTQYKNRNAGLMTWGQGVKIGMGIVLLGTVINFIYLYIFATIIEPDFYAQVEEVTRNGLMDAGFNQEQIDTQIEMQSKFQGTLIGNALGILTFAFLGFAVSAIVAAIKKASVEDNY